MKLYIFSIFYLAHFFLYSQKNSISPLKLNEIMKGNEFIGFQPENIRWSIDGKTILFDWNPNNEVGNSTYIYSLDSKKYSKASKEDLINQFEADELQRNFQVYYFAIEGALIEYDLITKKNKIIYQTRDPISNIQRVNNSENVYFQQNNNLYLYDNFNKNIKQITNFILDKIPIQKATDSTFLIQQQDELFQFIKDKKTRNEWSENQNRTRYSFPSKHYIEKGELNNLQISANGKFVTFRIHFQAEEKTTHIENFISTDGRTYTSHARPKVSNNDPNNKLGIYNIISDSVYFVDFSTLSNIRSKPSYLAEYKDTLKKYLTDRNLIPHSLHFSKNGLYSVVDVRSYDNKDRWIVNINLIDGKINELETQHDEAWIGGPGISEWNESEGVLNFLNDGETIYFQSEITGYSHLYTLNLKTKIKQQLTFGKYEIHDVKLSKDGKIFYLTSNKLHSGNREFYSLEISSKQLKPILTQEGAHQITLSPDEKTLAIRYSSKNKPWELYIAPNIANSKMLQLTKSTSKQFDSYPWRKPETVTFKGSDGVDVYARVYSPSDSIKNKAAVIFVHGAGYLQNAHNYWSSYYREYMFHNLLSDNGFTIIDIDYRASEGYGRDYRTAIYRHMGGQDLQDQIAGKKYLVEKMGIDSNRVGIYGGSYGGFITLMSMLATPKNFPCGAALRSVTDWAHYNHEYTSNILNYPDTDPNSYKKSSPIYFANNLEGKLLILHGMVDDNVQFQDVVRLSQRFIELEKTNWELAIFPVEAHGFKESYSWNDEYRRIYDLFYEELVLKSK